MTTVALTTVTATTLTSAFVMLMDNTSLNLNSTNSRTTLTEDELFSMYRPLVGMIERYITPLWYFIGFPCNVLAFWVWVQRRMRHSSGCYLAALALADFVFLALQMLWELHNVWRFRILNMQVLCQVYPVCFLVSQYMSPLLVLGFTFERYIAICHPFQRERFCTTSKAIRVICGLIVFCLALHAVQAYFWLYDDKLGDCSPRAEALVGGATSLWSVWSWVTELLIFGAVPITILVLNIFVIRETQKLRLKEQNELSLKTASSSSKGSSGPSATTFMLLVVSFYLIFSTLPVTVCYALYPQFPRGDLNYTVNDTDAFAADSTWQRYLNYVEAKTFVQELGMSHYACNFFIYLATGRMFRRQLRQLLLCGRHAKSRQNGKNYYAKARTNDKFENHGRTTKQNSYETNGAASSVQILRTFSE